MKVLLFFMISIFSLSVTANRNVIPIVLDKPDHSEWSVLLKKYVDDNGNVNYKFFQKDKSKLATYLDVLAKNSPSEDWSKNEKLAYYINLYNAATVKLILDNYPVKSIKDIKNPWDKNWVKIGSDTFSLGDIEHKILRKMNEPRIHFSINCASYSCPKLSNKAYLPNTIDEQLQKAAIIFINDKNQNVISKNTLQLSNIFKWYKSDFTDKGSLIEYLQLYSKVSISDKAKINYINYDWSLNEIK